MNIAERIIGLFMTLGKFKSPSTRIRLGVSNSPKINILFLMLFFTKI